MTPKLTAMAMARSRLGVRRPAMMELMCAVLEWTRLARSVKFVLLTNIPTFINNKIP